MESSEIGYIIGKGGEQIRELQVYCSLCSAAPCLLSLHDSHNTSTAGPRRLCSVARVLASYCICSPPKACPIGPACVSAMDGSLPQCLMRPCKSDGSEVPDSLGAQVASSSIPGMLAVFGSLSFTFVSCLLVCVCVCVCSGDVGLSD